MSFRPTSTSGSVSARWPRWHISVPPSRWRVVVLVLGEAVVDDEDRAALEALGEGRDERLGLRVQLGRAAGGKLRASSAELPRSAGRPGERRAPSLAVDATPRSSHAAAVEMEQVDRHRVEHFVGDDDAGHRRRQRVEPADAIAERRASLRAGARAAAPTPRRSNSAAPARRARRAARWRARRCRRRTPTPRRCRLASSACATWRASARPKSGDSSGAVTKSLPDLGHRGRRSSARSRSSRARARRAPSP